MMTAQIMVVHDQQGNTLTVWFGNPQNEVVAEETVNEIILMKDKNGNVIGFEKLNYVLPASTRLNVAFETVAP